MKPMQNLMHSMGKINYKGKEAQEPPIGTIKRGFEIYEYENTTAGYELAKANLKSPFRFHFWFRSNKRERPICYLLCYLSW
jgi:hypothetical protein